MIIEKIFNDTLVLENSRVRLQPYAEEHFASIMDIALDEAIWKWTSPLIRTKEDVINYGHQLITFRENKEKYPFIILDKQKNQIAGITTYLSISDLHKRLEIGSTWLGKNFQRTGINKVCKFLLLQYAFEQLDVVRVELKTDANNWQSRKAIGKIGAKEEGLLRHHMIMPGGRIRDTVYFSIVKEEWPIIRSTIFKELANPCPDQYRFD